MSIPVKRVAIFATALLFLGTSIAFTVAVVIQMSKDSKDSASTSQIEVTPNNPENQEQAEEKPMLQGTKLENFEPVASVSQLQSIDLQEGAGEVVPEGARVVAHYTGALAKDGTIFQSSHDTGQPVPFGLDQVIAGWTQGVPGMKVGGKRRLIIPASLAYGEQERPGIPANSDLVFDIELVSIEK